MSELGDLTCGPDCVSRAQNAVASALWHYTITVLARPYYVRGCIPDAGEPSVTVALWTGPAARAKRNLLLYIPLIRHGLAVPTPRVVSGLVSLQRGNHFFGFTGRRFDGKRIMNGSHLVEGLPGTCLCGHVAEPERSGFYFERPGRLRQQNPAWAALDYT
jgi:hypothetical protein